MDKRFLNAAYIVEVINGRLNGSAEQVESKKSSFDYFSYIKKIGNRATVSAPCQKFAIKKFAESKGYELSKRMKNGKKISISAMPDKYIDEDVFGFMRADNDELTEDQFNQLSEIEKKTFKHNKKNNIYTRNITKKRKSRFLMSHLTNISNRSVNLEWNVATSQGDSLPYVVETSSGIFQGISNIDIENISKFIVSDVESQYRDFTKGEAADIAPIEVGEKLKRIEVILRGLQYLSIQGNQNNYLTDTSPKLIILGEYSWGNNVFQGIIKSNGLDIDAFLETFEENKEYQKSDIWIGVSKRIIDQNYTDLKERLNTELSMYENIHITTIKGAFDGYLEYLYESFGLKYERSAQNDI